MIALMVGLLVVAAAGTIFLSSLRTSEATETLGRVQESAGMAFELLARDLREAGGNPCDMNMPVVSVVDSMAESWLNNWGQTISGNGDTVSLLFAGEGTSVRTHDAAGAQFELENAGHGLSAGDLVLVCDFTQGAMFRVSAVSGANVGHGVSHNCSAGLGLPVACDGAAGNAYVYPRNSILARVNAARWLVADNARGGTSLYREVLASGGTSLQRQEIVENVAGMQLEYLVGNAYSGTLTSAQQNEVNAVRVTLDFEGEASVERQIAFVVSLRNRNP